MLVIHLVVHSNYIYYSKLRLRLHFDSLHWGFKVFMCFKLSSHVCAKSWEEEAKCPCHLNILSACHTHCKLFSSFLLVHIFLANPMAIALLSLTSLQAYVECSAVNVQDSVELLHASSSTAVFSWWWITLSGETYYSILTCILSYSSQITRLVNVFFYECDFNFGLNPEKG